MVDRVVNGAMGLAGLIVFVVTYPLIALAIKADSRGPVIFSQKRVGLKGRTFTFFKYRTMSHEGHKPYETPKLDAEHFRTFVFITPASRLTRVGRFLRANASQQAAMPLAMTDPPR